MLHQDRSTDVATFAAHLLSARFADAEECIHALIQGYCENLGARANAGRALKSLPEATALALLYIAHHPFRRAEPQWKRELNETFRQIEQLLDHNCNWLEV